jgi:hypothetical protein
MRCKRLLSGLAVTLLAALSGCGGGGGSGASGPAGDTIFLDLPTGLVPPPPQQGATLYADAATLRVPRAGASWTYSGVIQPQGVSGDPSQNIIFTDTVTHETRLSGVKESRSNLRNAGPGSWGQLNFANGTYTLGRLLWVVGNKLSLDIFVTELRSPVVVNDQYVSLDRHIVNGGADFDSDNINDAVDVVMYSRVVGEELVELPNGNQIKAVRVDLTTRIHLIGSKTQTVIENIEQIESNWYAPGLGVVKTRWTEPNRNDGIVRNGIMTETLLSWDGLP